MAGKRKRSTKESNTSVQRKRSKAALTGTNGSPAQPHPHGQFDDSQEYKIRAIIAETATRYHIEWEDDEVTGEKFEPTWEPKAYANRLAVEDWEETKRQKRAESRGFARKTTAPRGRGRPRRTIDSSPPPQAESPLENGRSAGIEQRPPEEDLEIGESQPGAPEFSDADSPLFVSAESPKPRKSGQPSVHISDPPSSYAAGGYQAFSSSQILESAAPRRQKSTSPVPESSQVAAEPQTELESETFADRSSPAPSAPAETARQQSPEPSQWQPQEGDTSKTTEYPTEAEISAAPTSSSAPAQSVPVNFGERPNRIVPDSQSQPDSSSFAPSGTDATDSSSASEARKRGRPPKEVTQLPLSQAQGEQSSWQGLSSQPAAVSQTVSGTQVDASQQTSSGAALQASQRALGGADSASQAQQESHRSSSRADQAQSSITHHEASNEQSHGGDPLTSQFGSQPVPEQSQGPIVGHHSQRSQPQSSNPVSSTSEARDSREASAKSQSLGTSQLRGASESRTDQEVTRSDASSGAFLRQLAADSQVSDIDVRESTEPPDSNHVDLTTDTQPPAGQTSSIQVTPLPPRHTIAAQRNADSNFPVPTWPSPFPFNTQIAPNFSSTATGPPAQSQGNGAQSQSLPRSQPNPVSSLAPAFEPSTAPAAFSSPIRTSSPIPPGPSQSLRTFAFGESAPARPQTPSSPARPSSQSSNMDSQSPFDEARAKLKAMRARHRAINSADGSGTPASVPPASAPEVSPPKSSIPPHVTADVPPPNPARLASPLLQVQDGARSPSVVPAMEDLPEITTEEMNTSERYPTLLPQASIPEGGERGRNGSLTGRATPNQQPPSDSEDPEKASSHIIPIGLLGHQRDQQPQMVYHYQDSITKFLETRNPNERLIEQVKTAVERLRLIALHPDLDNSEALTQYEVEPAQQAVWDVSCSSKFRFLKTLLDALREEKMRIVVAIQPGKLVDVLKTFLTGVGISHATAGADTTSHSSGSSQVKVTILTQEVDGATVNVPDLIIDLDNGLHDDSPTIRRLRNRGDGRWCPLATLVVPRSIEHLEYHLSPSLSDKARLRALVSGINQLKGEAGRLEEGQVGPKESAEALAAYLKDHAADKRWPLVGLSSLEDLDSQTESEIEPLDDSIASPAAGGKRHRTDSDSCANDADLNKRARTEPSSAGVANIPTTVNPQDVELTHISDSIDNTGTTTSSNPIQTETEQRLQTLLQETQSRADDLSSALSDLQYRFEDSRTHLLRLTTERDSAAASFERAAHRMTESATKESQLRATITSLKEELQTAQTALLSHSVPERAELEALRQSFRAAEGEKETLTRRLEQARKDAEYVRDQYQTASLAAQREVASTTDLRNRVAVLTNQASGEQARLRRLHLDARGTRLEDENKRLRALLGEREAGLRVRDEEIAKLREASRGRMGTRGTSVPRSRQASPAMAAGEAVGAKGTRAGREGLLHPLRNNA